MGFPRRYRRTVLRAIPTMRAISRIDFPCTDNSCMVLMVPLLIMAASLVSEINTRVAPFKGWVNSFLAFMGQLYIGFHILKMVLVGAIIGVSAWHVGWIQPRLARVDRLANVSHAVESPSHAPGSSEIGQVKYEERDKQRLLHLLTWL